MRKCKTASFDQADPFEVELLAHAEAQGKFSKYIKRLIQRDKEGAAQPVAQMIQQPVETTDEDHEAMGSYF